MTTKDFSKINIELLVDFRKHIRLIDLMRLDSFIIGYYISSVVWLLLIGLSVYFI